jgi:hydroxyacylglutathione hydrolase
LRAYADVLCHPDAVEQAQGSGGRDYWRTEKLALDVRILHGFSHRFVWDGGPVHVDATVRPGDVLAGFEVVDLPGHAPGLIGLWRERDRVALVSDCFYMTDMHGRSQPPAVPLDAYNLDTAEAKRSIAKLAARRPAIVCPGHLGPLTGPDVVAQLAAAAA